MAGVTEELLITSHNLDGTVISSNGSSNKDLPDMCEPADQLQALEKDDTGSVADEEEEFVHDRQHESDYDDEYSDFRADEDVAKRHHFCFHKDQNRLDIWILLVHLSIIITCAGIGLLIQYDKKAATGLCLLATSFDRGGVVFFSRLVYWCDIVIYNILISSSVALSCITSKWIGQLFSHVKWLKIELVGVIVTTGLCLVALILYTYKVANWCSQLNLGRQPDYYDVPVHLTKDNHCGDDVPKPAALPQCQCDARYMDTEYKPAGEIKLETAYIYACCELAFSWLLFALWMTTMFLMSKRFKVAWDARQAWIRSVEEACRHRAETENFQGPHSDSTSRLPPVDLH